MKATLTDLLEDPAKIVDAIERNERVTLSKSGMEIADIIPRQHENELLSLYENPAFGMWADREDLKENPVETIRSWRKRFHDI